MYGTVFAVMYEERVQSIHQDGGDAEEASFELNQEARMAGSSKMFYVMPWPIEKRSKEEN